MTFYHRPALTPATIIYGSETPDLRLRFEEGTQIYFCRRNRNLRLRDEDFKGGTFEAGALLGAFCREHCLPERRHNEKPCPALVESYKVGTNPENKGLATVELHLSPSWDQCPGARALLDMCETKEERFFFQMYLEHKFLDESSWRTELVDAWNATWWCVHQDPFGVTRRQKFERMLWGTLRFPALIPQVWLNWLYATSDEHAKALEENPSRVDFVAFHRGDAHIVEIDGPSHYAAYDERLHEYCVDEEAYARNLKIERSLRRHGWNMTRIGRSEVREALHHEFDPYLVATDVLRVLPFWSRDLYADRPTLADFGLRELEPAPSDDIPF